MQGLTEEIKLMYPKSGKKKKRKKHGKSIMQDQSCKQCFLCMLLDNDYREKPVHNHHIFYGNGRRQISETYGFTVNLCIEHHNVGKESVHQNKNYDRILKRMCQQTYETDHSHEEFLQIFGENFI